MLRALFNRTNYPSKIRSLLISVRGNLKLSVEATYYGTYNDLP